MKKLGIMLMVWVMTVAACCPAYAATGRVRVQLKYPTKEWYNKKPSYSGSTFVINKKKLTTNKYGKTKFVKLKPGKYKLKNARMVVFSPINPKTVTVRKNKSKTINIKVSRKDYSETVRIEKYGQFYIWPASYGQFKDSAWWNKIPKDVKRKGFNTNSTTVTLPMVGDFFDGKYYVKIDNQTYTMYLDDSYVFK